MSVEDLDLAETIVERICWALDIQCTKMLDKGRELEEVYTDQAQTMIDIAVDELDNAETVKEN